MTLTKQLYAAAQQGCVRTVSALIRAGADPCSEINWFGETPLHAAASRCHVEIVRTLVAAGANVDAAAGTIRCTTPLLWAMSNLDGDPLKQKNCVEVIRILLTAGASVHVMNSEGWTPLHKAAYYGNVEVIQALIERGANIHATTFGSTPLHLAACCGRIDAIRCLISSGANMHLVNHDDDTVLHYAVSGGSCGIVGMNPDGRIEAMRFFAELGVNVSAVNKHGDTALHIAARNGDIKAIRFLLTLSGVDINARDFDGRTPLHIATKKGHVDAICTLQGVSTDIRAVDKDGRTALHVAAENNNDEDIGFFVKLGADVNAADKDGWTPLHVAVRHSSFNSVRTLLTMPGIKINTHLYKTRLGAHDIAIRYIRCVESRQKIIKLLDEAAATRPPRGTDDTKLEMGFWGQYYVDAVNRLLPLRLAGVDAICMQAVTLNEKGMQMLHITLPNEHNKVVLPIIYEATNKPAHWVGIIIDYIDGSYQVAYIDPENNAMPDVVREAILTALPANTDVAFTQMQVTAQSCSDNCGPEWIEGIAQAITGHRVPESLVAAYHSELLASSLAVKNTSNDEIKRMEVEAKLSIQPVLHLDTIVTSFNAFMKLAYECSSNLQAYSSSLVEQANGLLNKLLDAARETIVDAIMITILSNVVDAVNSGTGHVPPYPGKPFGDPDDAGGYGGAGGKEPKAQDFDDIDLAGNHTVSNATYTFSV